MELSKNHSRPHEIRKELGSFFDRAQEIIDSLVAELDTVNSLYTELKTEHEDLKKEHRVATLSARSTHEDLKMEHNELKEKHESHAQILPSCPSVKPGIIIRKGVAWYERGTRRCVGI